jgi:hypothetical protein
VVCQGAEAQAVRVSTVSPARANHETSRGVRTELKARTTTRTNAVPLSTATRGRQLSGRNTCSMVAFSLSWAHDYVMARDLDDDEWDRTERNETPTERLDRNWSSLLQELRVVQTGVQLLTGFLLTVPFQDRFYAQDNAFQIVYLVTVGASVAATVLLLAPVSMHRILFRRHRLDELVRSAQHFALGGLAMLGVALTGVVVMVFELVIGRTAGWIAGVVSVLAFVYFWFVFPWRYRDLDD